MESKNIDANRFSRLLDEQVESAYELLKRVFAHLESRGRRQRITKTSWETYLGWQSEKANFGVWQADTLVGLVTIRNEVLDDWPGYRKRGPVKMIRALATDPEYLGRGVGRCAMEGALAQCDSGETVFLDCVSGFLPAYYQSLGFELVDEIDREWPGEPPYRISLLCQRV